MAGMVVAGEGPVGAAGIAVAEHVAQLPADEGGAEGLVHERRVIPTLIDQNPCAHWRRPMDMMRQGWSVSSFQASQQWSTMSS